MDDDDETPTASEIESRAAEVRARWSKRKFRRRHEAAFPSVAVPFARVRDINWPGLERIINDVGGS